MHLPIPPRYDSWPPAVLHAMRLRGALLSCGPGFRGAGWPDSPMVRLSALSPWLDARQCAAHRTAAWVWGALDEPGTPLYLAVQAGRVRRAAASGVHRLNLRLAPGEVERLGAFHVTSKLRTLLDMLHDPRDFNETDSAACHALVTQLELSPQELCERITQRHKPYRILALARLQQTLAHHLAAPGIRG